MHNPFRNIHLTYHKKNYARANAQNHVFSFLRKVRRSQVIYTLSANRSTSYSWSNYKYHMQATVYAKLSLFSHCQVYSLVEILRCSTQPFSHCHCFNSYLSYWSLCYNYYLQIQCSLLFILPTAWKYKRLTSN